jgi:hypothetical protein
MAASLTIEEERGTYLPTAHLHQHNGYYAGDFSTAPLRPVPLLAAYAPLHT